MQPPFQIGDLVKYKTIVRQWTAAFTEYNEGIGIIVWVSEGYPDVIEPFVDLWTPKGMLSFDFDEIEVIG
jgi:hypothetical protein